MLPHPASFHISEAKIKPKKKYLSPKKLERVPPIKSTMELIAPFEENKEKTKPETTTHDRKCGKVTIV